jgi:predicted ATPase/DNA-binding SARP family transcriptional activator
VEVRVLGPLEVVGEDGSLTVEAPKERAILEVLGLRAGDVVPTEVLIDALWGSAPPKSAPKTLQSHISRLRRQLPAQAIATVAAGYRLCVAPDDVDAPCFERLVAAGRAALDGGNPRRAAALLQEAATLWRGVPLADVADGELRQGQVARFDELRATAEELAVEARLALGHHEALIGPLEALVAEQPLRERRWGQLMLALYRSRRRPEALDVYQRLRQTLGDELGIEPSEELQHLEVQILRGDSALDPGPPPPPRSVPTPLTSFVGRDLLVRDVRKLLQAHRLVTLVGPGGVGKSRLAIEVAVEAADDWPDGTWWLDLARTGGSSSLAPRLVQALDITVPPGAAPGDALRWALAPQSVLVVLDNAEALTGSLGAELADLLEAGPGVVALVTSRMPLGVPGEHEVRVPPLEVPVPGDTDVVGCEAVRLLLDRMADRRDAPPPGTDDLDALAELCRLVDGLPLGIELMAARVGHQAPADVLEELRDRTALLTEALPGHDTRHASLRAVLDSTMELLGPDARACLGHLAQMPADVDTATARAVVGPGLVRALDRLVASGLVVAVDPGRRERRLRLLDTVRAYGLEVAEPLDVAVAAQRHAEHLRELAREAGTHMEGTDEARWLERLRREDANLRAALAWWDAHDPSGTLAFACALGRAWYVWGDLDGVVALLERMLEIAEGTDVDPDDLAWVHLRLTWPRLFAGDVGGARAAVDEAVDRFARLNVPTGQAMALASRAHLVLLTTGDVDAGLVQYREALEAAQRAGLHTLAAWIRVRAAQALLMADRADVEVDAMVDQAEAVFATADNAAGLAHVALDRMFAAYARDELIAADAAARDGIGWSQAGDTPGYEHILMVARAAIRVHQGELAPAADLLGRALAWARDDHNLFVVGIGLQAAAVLAAGAGDPVRAARLWGAAGNLAPVWPMFARRYGALLAPARDELGNRFDREVAAGAGLALAEALGLVPTVDGVAD